MINISSYLLKGGLFVLVFLGVQSNSFSQHYFLRDTGLTAGEAYRTWAIGVQAGVLSPVVFTGGTNDFKKWNTSFGYGLNVRKQLSSIFALQVNALAGELNGSNSVNEDSDYRAFETKLSYAVDARVVMSLGSFSFLKHDKNLQFNVATGVGKIGYQPVLIKNDFTKEDWRTWGRQETEKTTYFPVAVSAKFKVSNVVSFSVNYHTYFLNGDLLDGYAQNGASSKDRFSYGSAGLEITLGNHKNRDLAWVNPIALLYDNLNYTQEKEDIQSSKDLLDQRDKDLIVIEADEDGDGVSDFYDECPGTTKGTVVSGAGCPILTDVEISKVKKRKKTAKYMDVEMKKVKIKQN